MAAARHLDVLQISDPCPLPWDALRGNDRVKYCGTCDKNVYDLSQMRADEAEALLESHGESLCVQYYARADGTVVTADCTPSRLAVARQKARRAMLGAGAMLAGLLAFTVGLAALLLGWVSRDRAAPVVAKLEETRKVLQPMIPLPAPPVAPPAEPRIVEPPHHFPPHSRSRGGLRPMPQGGYRTNPF